MTTNGSKLIAFTDGSYDKRTNTCGYGVVFLIDDGVCERVLTTLNGKDDHPMLTAEWNIGSEIVAVIKALDYAIANGFNSITICHDLIHIGSWARGEYKTKSALAKLYVKRLREQYFPRINITFEKVKAHSKVKYNELADELAKQALGIG